MGDNLMDIIIQQNNVIKDLKDEIKLLIKEIIEQKHEIENLNNIIVRLQARGQ